MRTTYILSAIFCFLLFSKVSRSQQLGKLSNLGPRIRETVIQGSAFAQNESGDELIYTVVRGWAPNENIKTFDLVPVSGAKAITCLINGPELICPPSGKYYGSVNGNLLRIDPVTMEVKDINISGSYLTTEDKGTLYFAKSLNLRKYEP